MNVPSSDPYWYLHVARATDLSGRDRRLYRAFEMLPAVLSISTLALFAALSFWQPVAAAYVTIAFSMYWLFKTMYLSVHLRHNFRRIRYHLEVDWRARLAPLAADSVTHLVIFPFFEEGYDVLAQSIEGLLAAGEQKESIAVVLAAEARAGERAIETARRIREAYGDRFLDMIVTVHPSDIPGEIPGKGANLSWAAEKARAQILDARGIAYDRVLVSAFDSDTVVYPDYFRCLTWHFLTAEEPMRSSYQPVPLFNNNIWDAPTLSRVMAYSSSFWQMIQQERPEKLATFSSHAVPFKTLFEAGYWQRNVVSEDSRIFWNLFVRYDGDYRVVPLAYPVSMDANVAPTFWGTAKNIYKQHRRWTYGAENIAYILFAFLKNPRIPFLRKLYAATTQVEGFWSLVTHPLILFAIGWLPLFVGGRAFGETVLSYNLPVVARAFLTAAMLGLVVSAIISMYLVPPRPSEQPRWRSALLALQWVLIPITMVVFSSIPGLDAQLRLFAGRYMGFWVTPKRQTKTAA